MRSESLWTQIIQCRAICEVLTSGIAQLTRPQATSVVIGCTRAGKPVQVQTSHLVREPAICILQRQLCYDLVLPRRDQMLGQQLLPPSVLVFVFRVPQFLRACRQSRSHIVGLRPQVLQAHGIKSLHQLPTLAGTAAVW